MAFLISAYAMILRAGTRRRAPQPRSIESRSRILCLTRAGIGDMIDTLPVLHTLRRHYPQAHLTVACDLPTVPIAQACPAVDDVIALESGWNPWQTAFKNAARFQDYDWVIAAVADFDRRLALLTRLTNASIRVGFERRTDRPSTYYTDPVALPNDPDEEHQVDTLLRLLKPLGLVKPTAFTVDLSLRVPDSSREIAAEILAQPPFASSRRFMLIYFSSAARLKFREEDFIALAGRVLASTDFAVGLVAAPADEQKAHEIAMCMGSKRIIAVATPGPLELAALLEQAAFLLTPEGETARLAAAVETPAIVLWSEGPFKKGHSRGKKHTFVHAEPGEETLPVERVWQALQPFLTPKKDGVEKQRADLLELPPTTDFMP
jgi:ADP-heptose:LPS heptosyltransferase